LIPLHDTAPRRRLPLVNTALIALCAVAFGIELSAGSELDELIHRHALIPARLLGLVGRSGPFDPEAVSPLVTSIFLHGGLLHFAGNMLFLWIFGDNVEDRFGHLGYAAFYLAGGIAAGLAHVLAAPRSVVPTIGASGAIAAVMGAYFLMYPRARIRSLVFLGFWLTTASIPALVYLGVWFAMQLTMGMGSVGQADQGGIAWWAHAGGFAFGAGAILVLGRRPAS
jgi:membrane associated rhomboid family serine protease